MVMARKNIGDYMLEKGYASQEQLDESRKMQQATGGDLANALINVGINPRDVYESKAQEMGVPFVDLTVYKPAQDAITAVPEHVVKRLNVLPLKKENNILYVAMSDTSNMAAVDDLRLVSRCTVRGVLAAPDQIEDALGKYYTGTTIEAGGEKPSPGMNPMRGGGGGDDIADTDAKASLNMAIASYGSQGDASKETDEDVVDKEVESAPIVRLANTIIQAAIKERASDIHIEPDKRNTRIRYRVDGVLHETMVVPKYIQAPMIARFKIMSEMNIAERRVPQDGRIAVKFDNKEYDLRVSCLPGLHGEKIVMRILDKGSIMIGMNKLGLTPEVQSQLEELSQQPNGMILTTGPTGSGKTTALYSLLNRLNSIERNIVTVEDPVEYQLSGVTQVQMNPKAGLTFGRALRSILRQDPDIIMVGEMRDLETASIGVEAALTGHLVLSTLHTNDAPSATIRLADMGVERFLIAATCIGIMAQRLGRKICTNCKEYYEEEAGNLRRFGFVAENENQKVQLARGRGCDQCRNTGYKGRIGFYELMTLNGELADMIVRNAPLTELKAAAKVHGMKELREDGLIKVLEGLTTPEEVMRVVFTAGY